MQILQGELCFSFWLQQTPAPQRAGGSGYWQWMDGLICCTHQQQRVALHALLQHLSDLQYCLRTWSESAARWNIQGMKMRYISVCICNISMMCYLAHHNDWASYANDPPCMHLVHVLNTLCIFVHSNSSLLNCEAVDALFWISWWWSKHFFSNEYIAHGTNAPWDSYAHNVDGMTI